MRTNVNAGTECKRRRSSVGWIFRQH